MSQQQPTLAETCVSCGRRLIARGDANFNCPVCHTEPLGRCSKCRDQSAPYICPGCGWRGP